MNKGQRMTVTQETQTLVLGMVTVSRMKMVFSSVNVMKMMALSYLEVQTAALVSGSASIVQLGIVS